MKVSGNLYKYCDWIMKFGYLNLLWILFTLMGLIVFGFVPATVALFTITRAWVRGSTEIPMWSTFINVYKAEFVQSNKAGFFYILGGCILFVDERFLAQSSGGLHFIMVPLLLVVMVLFGLSLLYFFAAYVHFELKPFAYIRYSLMISLSQFPYTVMMIAGVWFSYMLLKYVPGVFLFFGASLLAFMMTWAANQAFVKVQAKAAHLQKASSL
ncbi:YesL family protein [Fictibacillus fluitans]|uniref:YesL family protein n=1 Tax=Fictibacillus fluitans TaxID=3058422 RepID=A0ABT8HT88_9BACL|nr:YesL family protein [Fictibacillus sp. NE201]MDN4523995.1 YesL family protein [Fictibacillus sp. NE201]